MTNRGFFLVVTMMAAAASGARAETAAQDAKPRTYWWWFGDTVTTNGITHDLEAMQRLGLGGATICANHWMGLKPGPVKCLSDEWYDCIVWAGKEADRLGLELGFHDCPGWCDTGGPWVRPQYAQKHLVWTETRLTGGKEIDCVLPQAAAPFGIYREVAVIAIPDREEHEVFEGGLRDYVFAAPRIVSSIRLTSEKRDGPLDCFLPQPDFRVLVSDDGTTFREHARITTVAAEEILTLTFPAVKAKALRIAAGSGGLPSFRRAEVFATPLLPHATRKSYGRFVWNEQLVPQETFACPAKDAVALDEVVDLTDRVDAEGRLVWRAPAGKWLAFRFASTVMDKAINHVATPAGTGLECDKMSKEGVEEGARGPVTRIPELAKQHGIRSFRTVFSDSGEAPPSNWTEKMPEEFRALRGYDLRKFLPTMAGRFVGSTSVSERFLRDFRRTVGDLIVRHWGRYYAELMHAKGLQFEKQAYNWPYNQLEMSEFADIPMGEFWVHTKEGAGETAKLAGMEGDLWGRRIVSSEAFTDACGNVMKPDGSNEDIAELRREGDRRFARGVNRFVFHAYTHQPYDDPALRTNYWHFGIRIDRHHPKFDSFIPWVRYLTETQAQLQRGRGVADAVVLMREDVTLDSADWNIGDPYGYRSNAIERNQFLKQLAFRDGRLRLPSGMDYRVLALPQVEELSPEVLKKTLALAEAGAEVVLGPRPVGSPSLVGYPACDAEVEALAKKLWDGCPAKGSAQIGEGRVWRGVEMTDVYAAIGLKPDCAATEAGRSVDAREVVYTHRVDGAADIYFIANVTEKPKRLTVTFRNGVTREIELDGSSSAFVEFGDGQMAEDVDIDKLCPPRPETAAKFRVGAYPTAARPYCEAAKKVFAYMASLAAMRTLVETGEVDQNYQHNAYVAKTHAAHIRQMLTWARIEPAKRDEAMRLAKASAEYLLGQLEPAGAPLAHWPPTYIREPLCGDRAKNGVKAAAMVGSEPEGAVKYRGEVMLVYPAEAGLAFLDYWRETKDGRFLQAATEIGATYLRTRRPDGSWPLKLKLASGEEVGENTLVPTVPLSLFNGLFAATGEWKWREASDRCFAWLEEHPLKDWNWDGQFEDIKPEKPYQNPTKHNAVEAMFEILRRFPEDPRRIAQCRRILKFCEDRFVCWERPANQPGWDAPSVLEQYSCFVPIDASAAKMIRAYLAMWRATGESELLEKAKALGNTLTRVQLANGRIPTFWTHDWLGEPVYDWLNCMGTGAEALVELAAASGGARRIADAQADVWRSLPLGSVKPGGVFGARYAATMTNNLVKVDYDEEFIRPFVEKSSSERYVALGKMTEALVLFAKQTGDGEMLRLKRKLIAAILDNQLPDGYAGCLKEDCRLWRNWDAHEHAYIITALMTDWYEFGEQASLEGARRAADWVLANWKTRPLAYGRSWVNEPMHTIGQCEALLKLYAATGDRRYLDFCLNERGLADFDTPIFEGRDEMMWGHMYTYFNQCLAQHVLYRLRPDERLFGQTDRAVDFLWRRDGATIAGHGGICECWTDSQDGDGDVGETCATVYQQFVYDSCLRLGHGAAGVWGDRMERTVYNGLFAAQSPDGRKVRYYTPLLGERRYFDGDVYCCPNNYRRAIARLPQWLFYVRDDAVLANLYSDCEAKVEVAGTKVVLRETTAYPDDGRITIAVAPEEVRGFALFLRIPAWCGSPKVALNGQPIPLATVRDGLLRVHKTWKKGDEIVCDFPMKPRCIYGRKRQAGRFAVLKGPIVYAYAPPADDKRHPFDLQAQMVCDPATLTADEQGVSMLSNDLPFAVGVKAEDPNTKRIRLVPFADPKARITYFRAPDLKGSVCEPDELFAR